MFSNAARARTLMDSARDNRERIGVAVEADRLFDTYTIEMSPAEALSFAATARSGPTVSEALYRLIDEINRTMPAVISGNDDTRAQRLHTFHLGRRSGDRILVLDVFKGHLNPPSVDRLKNELYELAQKSGWRDFEEDETSLHWTFGWACEDPPC